MIARLGVEPAVDMLDSNLERRHFLRKLWRDRFKRGPPVSRHPPELGCDCLRGCDALGECDRPPHRPRGAIRLPGEIRLGQSLVAADQLGRIVEHERAVVVGEARLKSSGNVSLVDGKHDHLVVGEEVVLDRPAKAARKQRLTIERGIVHRNERGIFVACDLPHRLPVHARRRRHVEPFCAANVIRVMHTNEVAFVLSR